MPYIQLWEPYGPPTGEAEMRIVELTATGLVALASQLLIIGAVLI